MRKIVLFIASSLDGFIAGPNGEIDWLFSDADYGFASFFSSVDTVIMGRKTFELTQRLGDDTFSSKKCVVFSKHWEKPKTMDIDVVSDPLSFARQLNHSVGQNVWLVGGGEVASFFLNHHLVDEIVLSIHPIVLGKGIRLFQSIENRILLQLLASKSFDSGLVQLVFKVKKNGE